MIPASTIRMRPIWERAFLRASGQEPGPPDEETWADCFRVLEQPIVYEVDRLLHQEATRLLAEWGERSDDFWPST